jgi:hypothetical protein
MKSMMVLVRETFSAQRVQQLQEPVQEFVTGTIIGMVAGAKDALYTAKGAAKRMANAKE